MDNDGSTPTYASAGARSTVTTQANILSIKNPEVFNSLPNHALIQPNQMSIACDTGTAVATFYIYKNSTIGAGTTADRPNWSFVESGESCALQDVTADTITGGQFVFAYQLAPSSSMTVDVSNLLVLRPGETMTIAASSSSASTMGVAINWDEQQ